MNYAKYIDLDLVNGTGLRCTLFLTACSHACKGCYNESTWNPKSGHPVTYGLIEQIMKDLANRDGLSLSGGDPFHKRNRAGVLDLIKLAKERHPNKTIWVWSGYELAELEHLPHMQYIDVLIDGKYEQDKPTTKPFRGSDNQRRYAIENGIARFID